MHKKDERDKLIPLRKFKEGGPYSMAYLSNLIQRKKLKAKKVGRNYFTSENWFAEYLELHSRKRADDFSLSASRAAPDSQAMEEKKAETVLLSNENSLEALAEKIALKIKSSEQLNDRKEEKSKFKKEEEKSRPVLSSAANLDRVLNSYVFPPERFSQEADGQPAGLNILLEFKDGQKRERLINKNELKTMGKKLVFVPFVLAVLFFWQTSAMDNVRLYFSRQAQIHYPEKLKLVSSTLKTGEEFLISQARSVKKDFSELKNYFSRQEEGRVAGVSEGAVNLILTAADYPDRGKKISGEEVKKIIAKAESGQIALTGRAEEAWQAQKEGWASDWQTFRQAADFSWGNIKAFPGEAAALIENGISSGYELAAGKTKEAADYFSGWFNPNPENVSAGKEEKSEKQGIVVAPVKEGENSGELKERLNGMFSDEVKITSDESGRGGIINPVFDSEVSEQEYLYMMVPLNEE